MYLSIHILKDFKKIMLNFENCDKMRFPGVPPYGIPEIAPEHIDVRHLEWIPFNYAKTAKDRQGKGVHFYVDDYQFVRVWNHPEDYIQMLSQFGAVCTPDFSQYTDMPQDEPAHYQGREVAPLMRHHSEVIFCSCYKGTV